MDTTLFVLRVRRRSGGGPGYGVSFEFPPWGTAVERALVLRAAHQALGACAWAEAREHAPGREIAFMGCVGGRDDV